MLILGLLCTQPRADYPELYRKVSLLKKASNAVKSAVRIVLRKGEIDLNKYEAAIKKYQLEMPAWGRLKGSNISQPTNREESAAILNVLFERRLSLPDHSWFDARYTPAELYDLAGLMGKIDFKNGITEGQSKLIAAKLSKKLANKSDSLVSALNDFIHLKGVGTQIDEARIAKIQQHIRKKGLLDAFDEMGIYRNPGVKDALKASWEVSKHMTSFTLEALGMVLNAYSIMNDGPILYILGIGFTNRILRTRAMALAKKYPSPESRPTCQNSRRC